MNISQIEARVNEIVKTEVLLTATEVTEEMTNNSYLHSRALPSEAWITEDALVIRKQDRRPLDYYGGFEYVDEVYVKVIGDYVLYSIEASRVRDWIEFLTDTVSE